MRITITTSQGILVEQLEAGRDFDLDELTSERDVTRRESRRALADAVVRGLEMVRREDSIWK